jgi:hypothetical protein
MQTSQEIWRTAERLVNEVGGAAPDHASRWAHTLLEAGEVESRADWMRVMVACKVLLAEAKA